MIYRGWRDFGRDARDLLTGCAQFLGATRGVPIYWAFWGVLVLGNVITFWAAYLWREVAGRSCKGQWLRHRAVFGCSLMECLCEAVRCGTSLKFRGWSAAVFSVFELRVLLAICGHMYVDSDVGCKGLDGSTLASLTPGVGQDARRAAARMSLGLGVALLQVAAATYERFHMGL